MIERLKFAWDSLWESEDNVTVYARARHAAMARLESEAPPQVDADLVKRIKGARRRFERDLETGIRVAGY